MYKVKKVTALAVSAASMDSSKLLDAHVELRRRSPIGLAVNVATYSMEQSSINPALHCHHP